MVLWREHLFVANVLDPGPAGPPRRGQEVHGGWRFRLNAEPVGIARIPPVRPGDRPDRLLYVSSRPNIFTDDRGGQVLRFDPATGDFIDTFVSNGDGVDGGCTDLLTGPEGLVFGPDGRLYVTSFRKDATDTDKVLIFAGPGSARPGTCVGRIDLDRVGGPRSTAQTLLFGPGGRLFVPIGNVEVDGVEPGHPPLPDRLHAYCHPQMLHQLRPPRRRTRSGLVPDLRQDATGDTRVWRSSPVSATATASGC